MMEDDNRRQFERYAVDLTAHYIMDNDSESFECTIQELGPEGLRIKSSSKMPFGSRLVVSIDVPDGAGAFVVTVIVRWHKEIYGERNLAYIAGAQVAGTDTPLLCALLERLGLQQRT